MVTLVDKLQTFMYCAYNETAEYITDEWLADKSNIQAMIKLISYSIADNLKGLADGIYDDVDAYGIEYNVEVDFELLKQLKSLA